MNAMRTKLVESIREGQETLSKLPKAEKKELEKSWDIEHAYYSSALEGSKLDRKDFEKLGKDIK